MHTKGLAEVNGTRLAYEHAGQGHSLVLIHGLLVNRHLWDNQFEIFAQQYHVIRYDMRGFGDSAPITSGAPPYSSSADLYHLLRFLQIEKAYILGLSARHRFQVRVSSDGRCTHSSLFRPDGLSANDQ